MSFYLVVKSCSPSSSLCYIPLAQDFSGVTNVFLHCWDVCGVACSGGLFQDFLSKLAGWVRLDGKYVRSRFGCVGFGVCARLVWEFVEGVPWGVDDKHEWIESLGRS